MEEYKIIEGFPNYEVSNLGNVRNRYTKQILKPRIDRGHARVCLYNYLEGKSKVLIQVHRLVMNHFNPTTLEGLVVNHKDENPLNNRLDNLEWTTNACNLDYSNVSEKKSLKLSLPIVGKNISTSKEIVFRSATKAAKYIGYKIQGTISEAIRKGKTNKPIHGYTFRLANPKEISSLGESELYHKFNNY